MDNRRKEKEQFDKRSGIYPILDLNGVKKQKD